MLTPYEYESILSAIQALKVKDVLDTSVINIEYLFEMAVKELNDLAFTFDLDNTLLDKDISILFEWYKINSHFSSAFPFDTLFIFFNNYNDEKSVSNQWRTKMQYFLKNIKIKQQNNKERRRSCGSFFKISFNDDGLYFYMPGGHETHIEQLPIRYPPTKEINFENSDKIDLTGKRCVFTGACPPLSQTSVASYINLFGGIEYNKIDYTTDYLIVGHKNCDYARYGTKMNNAIFYRERYGAPLLVKIEDLFKKYPIKPNLSLLKKRTQEKLKDTELSELDANDELFVLNSIVFDDINNIDFYGKVVCATDSFYSKINRTAIIQMITRAGGIYANCINNKTNIIIIGEDVFNSKISSTFTTKVMRAIKFKKDGQDIKIIPESSFLEKFLIDDLSQKKDVYNG